MRLLSIGAILVLSFTVASGSLAQLPSQTDFTGIWLFTWQNDSINSNLATLKHEAGTITGTYINDAKEKCPVVGRIDSTGTNLTLTVTCPQWDIKCDGSIKSSNLVVGQYLAYGSATGDFQMSRQ